MNIEQIPQKGYEEVVLARDPSVGLTTIIAIYSTALGPALGGTRMWPFASEELALADVLRLAKAMAYKASAAGLNLGGGKAVVIADPRKDKTRELLQAYARVVDSLDGRYVTTADVGTTTEDLDTIGEVTKYVTGTSHGSGNPSVVTAYGVLHGLRAVATELWGSPSLRGKRIVVQGTGKVGGQLARHLKDDGATLVLSDIDKDGAAALAGELGAETVHPGAVLSTDCDILSPCALGPVATDDTLPEFACKAIAGAANNQLERPDHADALQARGILYAPDYVINAGGLINVEDELHGYDPERAHAKAAAIEDRLTRIFERARTDQTTAAEAADRLAEERIRGAGRST
ncbi:MAG: Leu/Phe/Val dehydrogenase [Actinomycetota bacterium]|nr:leucine dehydrogenase [Actinomycetota bacterium]